MLRRRTLLALPAVLVASRGQAAPVIRYGMRPPLSLPNVSGNQSPLGWRVGFFDDFTAFTASEHDEIATTNATTPTRVWQTTIAPGTYHLSYDKEQQYYCNPCWTPGINPFSQSGSILKIIASVPTAAQLATMQAKQDYQTNGYKAPFISGALNSRTLFPEGFYCGYFELNSKWPPGAGMWTAFWLNLRPPPYTPEIDIAEQIGSRPSTTTGTLHYGPKKELHEPSVNQDVGVDLAAGFHTYGCLWTPNYTAWYFDGRLLGASAAGIQSGIGFYNPKNPMDIRINFALGSGNDPPHMVSAATLPVSFDIDWFRYSILGPQ